MLAAAEGERDTLQERQTAAAIEAGLDGWTPNRAWLSLNDTAGKIGLELHHVRALEHGAGHLLAFLADQDKPITPLSDAEASQADATVARLRERQARAKGNGTDGNKFI